MNNVHMVSTQGELIRVMRPPTGLMSADDALEFTAWLVALAEPFAVRKFEDILEAVQNT